jgi:hypothetical protein
MFPICSFSDIFFIDATDVTTIETDLIAIAQAKKLDKTAKAALAWLRGQSHRRWLILFNNADDPDLPLRDYLPQCGHANILITSRNPNLRDDLAPEAYQKISSMTAADAKHLLLKGLKATASVDAETAADSIVKVRCHVLFIVLNSWHPLTAIFPGTWVPRPGHRSSTSLYSKFVPTGRVPGCVSPKAGHFDAPWRQQTQRL